MMARGNTAVDTRVLRRAWFDYLLDNGPRTPEELHEFIEVFFGYNLPTRNVCPHHNAPFDFVADQFSDKVTSCFGFGNRLSGKTMMTAILNACDMFFKPGVEICSAGAINDQAAKGYEYLQNCLVACGDVVDLSGGRLGDRKLAVVEFKPEKITLSNGSKAALITASYAGFNGVHPNRVRVDEIELIYWDVLQQCFSCSQSADGIKAQDTLTSTRKHGGVVVQKLLDESVERGFDVRSWCVPPGTLVAMANGTPRPIEAVKIDDAVLTHTGAARPVTKLWRRDVVADLVEVDVVGVPRPLRLTPEHRVPTATGWKEASDLTPDDLLLDPPVRFGAGSEEDVEDGWLVGFYLAEGCLIHRGNGLSFGVHEREAELRAERLSAWWARHPIPDGMRGPRASGPRVHRRPDSKGVSIECYHPTMRAFIEEWAVGTARDKHLTKLPQTDTFAHGVLTGWLDGDGWISHGSRVGQTSSVALAWQMLRLAVSLGWFANLWEGVNRPGPQARAAGRTVGAPFWRVTATDRDRIRFATTSAVLGEIRTLAARGVNRLQIARTVGLSWGAVDDALSDVRMMSGRRFDEHGVLLRAISDVRRIPYAGPVYDLTVDVDHTFLAEGIAVSNCVWETLERCTRKCKGDPEYGDCPMHSRTNADGELEYICGLPDAAEPDGKAHHLLPGGWFPVEDFVKKGRNLDKETFEAEWLCLRPERRQVVYGAVYRDEAPFVVEDEEMATILRRYRESPESWVRGYGQDFGANWATMECIQDPLDECWYVVWEYFWGEERDRTVAKHADFIKASDPLGFESEGFFGYGDPAGRQVMTDLEEHDIFFQPANNELYAGIQHVKRLFEQRTPAGLPKLRIFATCTELRKELRQTYVHPVKRDGTIQHDIVVKKANHAADGVRYWLYSFQTLGSATYSTGSLKGV